MNTPRTCYLPCSTVSWTSNCLKLKKACKCCLPFLFKKVQKRHWLSGCQVLSSSMANPLHCTPKLLWEGGLKRWPPDLEGRTSAVWSLLAGHGSGSMLQSQLPTHPKALLPLAMHIEYPPTDCLGNLGIQMELRGTELKRWGKASRCKI